MNIESETERRMAGVIGEADVGSDSKVDIESPETEDESSQEAYDVFDYFASRFLQIC